MEDYHIRARINHETVPHHTEALQKSIDSKFIDQIENSCEPSLNYIQALRHSYKEELDKSLLCFNQKTIKQRQYEKAFGNKGRSVGIADCLKDNYHEKKKNQIDRFTIENYDGGKSFFRSQDAYKINQQHQIQQTKQIMQIQLKEKQNKKIRERENFYQLKMSINQHINQSQYESRKRMKEKQKESQIFRDEMIQEIFKKKSRILQQKIKNKQCQKTPQRHNPITNPIEYHIENPYILRKMQTVDLHRHL